ncbi:protein SERAC1-like isoform X2 [Panulirus ornatus]|uniref:protein SERAC1-like isoform X2 n=1 Tax=Panulirus ornatus TaxID=150431 RepID=UPI003A841BC0
MTHVLSAVTGKLGVASAFILGAVIGNHLRKHKDSSVFTDAGSTLELTQEDDDWFIEEKRSSIIGKVYRSLQTLSADISQSDFIRRSYTEMGKLMCQRYLQKRGLLEEASELWLEEWLESAEWIDTVDFWTRFPAVQMFSSPTYAATLYAGVRALWYISCSSNFYKGSSFIDSDLAVTLKQVAEENDDFATPVSLKIIANVIAMNKNHQLIHETGLVDTLTHYANEKESQIFLPAWRGLHNLKLKSSETSYNNMYLEGVYPFVLPDEEKAPVLDIILVHGIKGGAAWTWRQHDVEKHRPLISQEQRRKIFSRLNSNDVDEFYTCCWPFDWLVPSLDMPVRIIAVNYSAGWWSWDSQCPAESKGKSLARHSEDLAFILKTAGVGERPIIWITHSMGGLLVKYMLMADSKDKVQMDNTVAAQGFSEETISSQNNDSLHISDRNLASQTVATVFFSVPHHGSPLATSVTNGMLRLLLRPTREVFEMRTDNPTLNLLHQSFVNLVEAQSIAVLTLNESEPVQHKSTGYSLYFVPSSHGDPGIGIFHEVDATHLDICKPLNRKADSYEKVVSFVQAALRKLCSNACK